MAFQIHRPRPLPGLPPSLADRIPVQIRHPGYAKSANVLLSLPSVDGGAGIWGIHFKTVHTACAIVANNRFDGWITRNEHGRDRIDLGDGGLLIGGDYYFHVPKTEAGSAGSEQSMAEVSHDSTGQAAEGQAGGPTDGSTGAPDQPQVTDDPYRYPVVPNFRAWKFPDTIPTHFAAVVQPYDYNLSLTPVHAVQSRDGYCLLTAEPAGCEFSHVIPSSEESWFDCNGMSRYAPSTASTRKVIHTQYNAILLRRDTHWLWDHHKFAIVPKFSADNGWVPTIHVTDTTSSYLADTQHNYQLREIRGIRPEYLFARFALNIFSRLDIFLQAGVSRTLVMSNEENDGVTIKELSSKDCQTVFRQKSRSQSDSRSKRRREDDANVEAYDDLSSSGGLDSRADGPSRSKRSRIGEIVRGMADIGYSAEELRIEQDYMRDMGWPWGSSDEDEPEDEIGDNLSRGRKPQREVLLC